LWPPRSLATWHLHPPQQAGARADVPGPVAELVQRLAVIPPALAVAGDAVDQDDVGGDVVLDVVADVVLDGVAAVDVGADLGEDLVLGAAHLLVEVASQRAEVLIEVLGAVLPACLDPLAVG